MMRAATRMTMPRAASLAALSGRRFVSNVFDLPQETFVRRHIGPTKVEATEMLAAVDSSFKDLPALMNRVVPSDIRREPMPHNHAMTETEALTNLRTLMMRNKLRKSFIGQGYYDAVLPPAIQRNVLENPGWYTPYTPYQAEISQGRLEALLNYQTAIMELTGMEIANASLLDEATAGSESVRAAFAVLGQKRMKGRNKVFIDQRCFAATIDMIRTHVIGDTEIVVASLTECPIDDPALGVIVVQTPDREGTLHDFSDLFAKASTNNVMTCCATDLMACTITKPAGEMGADFVFGNAQRFGIPLGFGGPHPAFFACKEAHKRHMPGRVIGVSKDSKDRRALRMALQTREQHIKRANATSNICTAQALLANMVGFYAVYHGPCGLKDISTRIHRNARVLALGFETAGHSVVNRGAFFDTVTIKLNGMSTDEFIAKGDDRRINVWRISDDTISISLDEATTDDHMVALLECAGMTAPKLATINEMLQQQNAEQAASDIPRSLERTTEYMKHDVFHQYRSETDLMRYIWKLQRKDYGLQHGMVPLGSCTMKLNPAATMLPMSWQRVTAIHPYVPASQAEGYKLLTTDLEERLKLVAGLDAVSLQPNSGSQGEYTGLRVIKSYLHSIGETSRNVVLVPANAHGTNPASSVVAGLKPVVVNCEKTGAVDMKHLAQLCEKHAKEIAAIMVTYPSTYGIYDEEIKHITDIIHKVGGQVYIDGANFNAMLGHTGPGFFGGDVCHFNLHKTFSIPHGGGGPGMGPIACREHLAPFLPRSAHNHIFQAGGSKSFGLVSQAPVGSASILTISYMLMTMLGTDGLSHCAEFAVLAANYLAKNLQDHFHVRFTGKSTGLVGHEFIIDMAEFGKINVKAEDVAKRLMDYGFHAPTLSFPVNNTLMIEPTESESKTELDRFIFAMKAIREEIRSIEEGKWTKDDNPVHNAPHTAEDIAVADWNHPYTRELAAYPAGLDSDTDRLKFWPTTSRVNNEWGDAHLFCSCGPVEKQ